MDGEAVGSGVGEASGEGEFVVGEAVGSGVSVG